MKKLLTKIGNSPDKQFEQSFFQLAFQRLEEKLYNLLPYLIGFEVVNKSPDGLKALGVFGFKSDNNQMLFVPAFFINGDVKGVDILYSKNNEQFYPLTEDFAEMFLKDDATGIGKPSHDTEQKINQDVPMTDLQSLVRPPRTGKVSYASVIDFVEQADEKVKTAFYNWFKDDDSFSEAVLKYYPVEKVAKAIAIKKAEKVLPMTSVKVYSKDDDLSDLSDSQKQEVYQKGRIIVDGRDEDQKSKFGLFNYPSKFTNPTESGFYNYLTNSGSLRYALILTHPMGLISHYPTDDAIVIDLDSSKEGQAYIAKATNVFVKGKYIIEKFKDVLSGMTDPAEAKPSYNDTYILINEKYAATIPFTITMNYKDDNGMRRIGIEPVSSLEYEYDSVGAGTSWSNRKQWNNSFYANKENKPRKFTLVMTKKPGDKLEYDHDAIYVPKGFKLFPIKLGYYDTCCDSVVEMPSDPDARKKAQDEARAKKELYMRGKPGNKSNLMGALREESIYPMTVSSNGSEYFVSVAEAKKKYDNAIKVKIAMITELGLDEKQADEILQGFRPHIANKKAGYIKFAYTGEQSFSPWDPTPFANQLGQPTYDGVGHMEVMQTGDGYKKDPTRMGLAGMPEIKGQAPQDASGPQAAINQASQLAQAGQKEIFDTHTIATLAKYVSPDSKVTSYTPDFVSCLDKLGRMLFLVHWETDKFEQMYGRSELPELVELLTNVFNNLGDLVIFLKRKSPQLSINMSEKDIGV